MEVPLSLATTRLDPMGDAYVTAAAPDAAAAQRFAELMQAPATEPTALAAAPAVAGQTDVAASGSVGDKILNGMQSVSNDFRETWSRVSDTLRHDSREMSMQDILGLQMHLVQAAVQYEMLGKAVSRSTQNFDQLVRVQ